MLPLIKQLQTKQTSLDSFFKLAKNVLKYIPNVLTSQSFFNGYSLNRAETESTSKKIRPIKEDLIFWNVDDFSRASEKTFSVLKELKSNRNIAKISSDNIDTLNRCLYTTQQMIGIGLDLLGESNSSRKHVGNRFEELIKSIVDELGLANKRIVLKIPYKTPEGEKIYRCENDLIISPFEKVLSTENNIHPKEIVLSVKTTSKDRMGKMFIDKMLLERFNRHDVKFIGIFLNDVQRKGDDGISYTLVSGLFMVYTSFLMKLEGIYYLDKPPVANKAPHSTHIFDFTKLLSEDLWKLLSP